MPELLTESFCERCGTRYTFESAAPTKTRKLGRFKTLSKGLKNYVMSDDTSLDEALAAARSDDEREMTAHQLDAFHATFNFCMTCRQYTCGNCWNAAEGRCLTCAPHLGQEIMPAPFQEAPALDALRFDASAWPSADLREGEAAAEGADAEPEFDLEERLARLSRLEPAEPQPVTPEVAAEGPAWPVEVAAAETAAAELAAAELAAAELAAAAEAAPEAVVEAVANAEPPAIAEHVATEPESLAPAEPAVASAEPVVAPEPAPTLPPEIAASGPTISDLPVEDVDGRAAAAARRTSSLLGKFRPGQSLDAELAAYEASLEGREALAAEGEPVAPEPVAASLEAEPAVAAPEPEPVAAAAPEPEPVAAAAPEPAAPEPEPVAAAEATPPAAPTPAPADLVEQPTWRIVAPDVSVPANGHPATDAGLPAAASAVPPPASGPAPEPQWPAAPDWPKAQSSVPFLAGRAVATSAATEALWAASVRDVVANPAGAPAGGVQPCSNCGLSLSATARFCRRCGTRQGG